MKTLRFDIEISDEQAAALEEIKSFLIDDDYGDLTEQSTIEEVYSECSERGLSLLMKKKARREGGREYQSGVPAWLQ